jgi:hypothetical protein
VENVIINKHFMSKYVYIKLLVYFTPITAQRKKENELLFVSKWLKGPAVALQISAVPST